MKLSQYGYDFAPEMLAKHPTENRDDSRLMVIDRAKGTIEHRLSLIHISEPTRH